MKRNCLVILMVALATTSCGGGGSGSTNTPSAPVTPTNKMSFAPSTLAASLKVGQTGFFNVVATPSNPSEFTGASAIYVMIVDTTGIMSPTVVIDSATSSAVAVTLSTSANAPAGQYTGNLQVKACADPACNSPFPGSPWLLPFNITVSQ
jgi:hypothetical protein